MVIQLPHASVQDQWAQVETDRAPLARLAWTKRYGKSLGRAIHRRVSAVQHRCICELNWQAFTSTVRKTPRSRNDSPCGNIGKASKLHINPKGTGTEQESETWHARDIFCVLTPPLAVFSGITASQGVVVIQLLMGGAISATRTSILQMALRIPNKTWPDA